LNKNQFIKLIQSSFAQSSYVHEPTDEQAFHETQKLLDGAATVLDAVFIWQDVLAKVPIVRKRGNYVEVYHIETKAFHQTKHRLTNHRGQIYPKWSDYLIDLAFDVYVIGKLYPQWSIVPILVLPNKMQAASQDRLFEDLSASNGKDRSFEDIGLAAEELSVKLDVSDLLVEVLRGAAFGGTDFDGHTFEQVMDVLKSRYFSDEKAPVYVGLKCKNCEFRVEEERSVQSELNGFRECWSGQFERNKGSSDELVFDLIGPGTASWITQEWYFQHQVPEDEIRSLEEIAGPKGRITERQRQSLQILKAKGVSLPPEIIRPQLFQELKRWEFPIHFLDFEAGNYILPVKKGRRPYHLVVFQYSCHSLHEDGTWQHYEWIDDLENGYPNYECIRRLQTIPGLEEGTVVQYSEFERNALKIIRNELLHEDDSVAGSEDLADWIEQFITRRDSNATQGPYLADLSRLVRNFYYNSRMGNSLSIKDVVQSVLTLSPYLKKIYERPYSSSNFDSIIWWQPQQDEELVKNPYSVLLEEQRGTSIRRGTEAMIVYNKLLNGRLAGAEKEEHIHALLKYCELDTLAMLMIFQHWLELMNQVSS
jgi:hypothetical protein